MGFPERSVGGGRVGRIVDHRLDIDLVVEGSQDFAEMVVDRLVRLAGKDPDVESRVGPVGHRIGFGSPAHQVGAEGQVGAGMHPAGQQRVFGGHEFDLGIYQVRVEEGGRTGGSQPTPPTKLRHSGVISTGLPERAIATMASATLTTALSVP